MVLAYRRYRWQRRKAAWAWAARRRSIREGFIGGDRVWLLIGLAVHGRRTLRKLMHAQPELVATERLEPGQHVTIRAIDPRSEKRG